MFLLRQRVAASAASAASVVVRRTRTGSVVAAANLGFGERRGGGIVRMASTNSSTNASVDDEEGGNSGGVVFSDVPSPHAVSVNVVAGAVDERNYKVACEFVDAALYQLFRKTHNLGLMFDKQNGIRQYPGPDPRVPGGVSLTPTVKHSEKVYDDAQRRYTVNRSPFVHNLAKEPFGFRPKASYTRRETFKCAYDPEKMKKVAEMLDYLIRRPLYYMHPTLSVEFKVEGDAYFKHDDRAYRETVTIGPWGLNIMDKKVFEKPAADVSRLHAVNPKMGSRAGAFSLEEDAALREVRAMGKSWDERAEKHTAGTVLEGRTARMMAARYKKLMASEVKKVVLFKNFKEKCLKQKLISADADGFEVWDKGVEEVAKGTVFEGKTPRQLRKMEDQFKHAAWMRKREKAVKKSILAAQKINRGNAKSKGKKKRLTQTQNNAIDDGKKEESNAPHTAKATDAAVGGEEKEEEQDDDEEKKK